MNRAVREAFRPFLTETACCMCSACRAVDDQRYITNCGTWLVRDSIAYWAAISEQLRLLAAGEHVRVEWTDHIRTLPAASMPTQVSISNGLYVGFGSGLHDRPHPPWVIPRAAKGEPDAPGSSALRVPVQLDLFEVAA